MSNVTQNGYYIYITAADPATGNLTMSDGGQTAISDHGATVDSIFWVVTDNVPNIEAITGVNFESGTHIFTFGPCQGSLLPGWKSVWTAGFNIGSSPVGNSEAYTISWTDTNGNPHTYDPRIMVNP